MKAYIICIIVVTLINVISEQLLKRNNKKIGILLLGISLFVICFIAGVRSQEVGTDVNVYVTRLINVSESSAGFFQYIKNANSDLFFAILIYFGYLFKDINVVLFFIELAAALPIYIYAYLERKNQSLTVTVLIFLLTMYCTSLNLMRQSIAISICLLAYHYFNEKHYKKATVTLLIATLFHKTALIFVIAFFINYLINKKIEKKGNLIFIFVICMVFFSLFMDKFIALTSYSDYLESENLMRTFSIGSILKKLFWIGLGIISIRYRSNDEKKYNNVLVGTILAVVSLILTILSFKIPGTGRLGYYFNDVSYFLLVQAIPQSFKQKKEVLIALILILALLWWNMTAVDNDSSKVYPYHSDLVLFLN